ncbi:MAG: calcium-binding protein [archaeon]
MAGINRLQEKEFEKMLEEATIDCYSEYEEFSGIETALDDELEFPFDALVLGRQAKITGVDSDKSSLRAGIIMKAEIDGKKHAVALTMIDIEDKDSKNAKWLGAVKWWMR